MDTTINTLTRRQSISLYVLGFFVIGLCVNVMNASNLGVGAWDTVTINLRHFMHNVVGWQWVTIGMMSFLVSSIIWTIVMNYRRKKRYIFMLVPMLLVFIFIDFWNLVIFQDRIVGIDMFVSGTYLLQNDIWQYVFFVIGSFILPLGLVLVVKSGFPAFVFDELMLMFVEKLKAKKITYIRLTIEFIGITIGTIFGFFAFYNIGLEGLGSVNVGSFVFTLFFSPIMAMWFRILKVQKHE